MRKFLLVAAASILIPFGGIQASVSSDIANGFTAEQIVANAQLNSLTIDQIMEQAAAIDETLIAGIVAAAIEAGLDPGTVLAAAFRVAPSQAKSISEAAQAKSVDFTVVAAASLGIPGIDPTQVTPASAAGGTTPAAGGTTPAAGGTTATQTITAPTFSSGGGSGGGGTGSPSA